MRPSCSRRLVATIRTIGDMIRTAPFWSSRENRSGISPLYCHSVSDTETSLASFEYATSCFEAERAPLSLGDHVAPECHYVLVPRHVSLCELMPPHRNFFVLCLDAARPQCTSWTMASLRIAATAEEHVQRPFGGSAIQKRVGVGSRRSA